MASCKVRMTSVNDSHHAPGLHGNDGDVKLPAMPETAATQSSRSPPDVISTTGSVAVPGFSPPTQNGFHSISPPRNNGYVTGGNDVNGVYIPHSPGHHRHVTPYSPDENATWFLDSGSPPPPSLWHGYPPYSEAVTSWLQYPYVAASAANQQRAAYLLQYGSMADDTWLEYPYAGSWNPRMFSEEEARQEPLRNRAWSDASSLVKKKRPQVKRTVTFATDSGGCDQIIDDTSPCAPNSSPTSSEKNHRAAGTTDKKVERAVRNGEVIVPRSKNSADMKDVWKKKNSEEEEEPKARTGGSKTAKKSSGDEKLVPQDKNGRLSQAVKDIDKVSPTTLRRIEAANGNPDTKTAQASHPRHADSSQQSDTQKQSSHESDSKKRSSQQSDSKKQSFHESDSKKRSSQLSDSKKQSFHESDSKKQSFHQSDSKKQAEETLRKSRSKSMNECASFVPKPRPPRRLSLAGVNGYIDVTANLNVQFRYNEKSSPGETVQFGRPVSCRVDGQGGMGDATDVNFVSKDRVLVTDMLESKLHLLNQSGNVFRTYVIDDVTEPWATVVTSDGGFILTSRGRKCVAILHADGAVKTTFGKEVLHTPSGVAFDAASDRIVVTDAAANKVLAFSGEGELVGVFGEDHGLKNPSYVAISPQGEIVVSDSGNHCVKVFSWDGDLLLEFGKLGKEDGCLKSPQGVATDSEGNVLVCDHYNDRVCIFSRLGEFVRHLVTSLHGIAHPQGLTLTPDLKLYVTHGKSKATDVTVFDLVYGEYV